MVKVVVTGISIYSCFGNAQATWDAIIHGSSGIRVSQPYPDLVPLPLGLIDSQPIPVRDLTLQLVQDLCVDAQLKIPDSDIGIVIGSSRGCQNQWEMYLRQLDKKENHPEYFAFPWLQTLPCQPAITCAEYLKTSEVVYSPANACATGLVAIAQGYELIQQQRCSQVLVGAVESPITPLTIAGFRQMKALAQSKCDPFGKDRDGFVLAEGGAMLLLETETSALARQAHIYGEIRGWGINCDAQGLTAPEFEATTAIKAIKKCLNMAQLQPEEVDYIHAHGTATILNDQREAKIINHLFPHFPLVSSTKGATGHTLGASGAIATALNFLSLQEQILLPNIAYSASEFKLNFCQANCNHSLQAMLCFSFGFGGQNAIIAMSKYE